MLFWLYLGTVICENPKTSGDFAPWTPTRALPFTRWGLTVPPRPPAVIAVTYGHCTSCLRHDIFLHFTPSQPHWKNIQPHWKFIQPHQYFTNPIHITTTPTTLQQPQQHIRITPLKSNAFNGDVTGGSIFHGTVSPKVYLQVLKMERCQVSQVHSRFYPS